MEWITALDPAWITALIYAVVGPLAVGWHTKRTVKGSVGTPNGNGTLTEMTERLLVGQGRQDEAIERIEGEVSRLGSRVESLERPLVGPERRSQG